MTPSNLTDRQREVARMVADGLTNKTIAALLGGVSVRYIQAVVSSVVYCIGIDGSKDERVEIARWWREQQEQKPAA